MRTNIVRMYRFFEPALKIVVGLLVNRITFSILEKLAGFYMFLIFCMAFIFYMRDRFDMTLTFVGVICLINLSLKYMGRNMWKIETWSRNRDHFVVIQNNRK